MSSNEPHVCGVCGLWVRKSPDRTDPALCWKHRKILEWDLVAVVEWEFRDFERISGTSFESRRTGNVLYLTIDEFREVYVEYQGDEPVPILLNTDSRGLRSLRTRLAALY